MTDLIQLLDDFVAVLQSCPEVADELDGDVAAVVAYTDVATQYNSVAKAVYEQPSGSVLIAWIDSGITEAEPQGWAHAFELYLRATRLKSPLALIHAVIDGTPEGSDLKWRYLCVNDDVLPVDIGEITRVPDVEGIDYYVIRCAFREKGD